MPACSWREAMRHDNDMIPMKKGRKAIPHDVLYAAEKDLPNPFFVLNSRESERQMLLGKLVPSIERLRVAGSSFSKIQKNLGDAGVKISLRELRMFYVTEVTRGKK